MRRFMNIGQIVAVVILFATGCAEQSSQVGSTPAQDGAVASANGSKLAGTWRGAFDQVQTGDSGRIHGDIECQIKDDGTYQMTWSCSGCPSNLRKVEAGSPRQGMMACPGEAKPSLSISTSDDGIVHLPVSRSPGRRP